MSKPNYCIIIAFDGISGPEDEAVEYIYSELKKTALYDQIGYYQVEKE
jgi:hypothetical protein